jgi:hypothetical protein
MTSDNAMDASMMGSHPTKAMSEHRINGRKQRAQRRSVFAGLPPSRGQEEVLVVDDRAHLRPAQVVEIKLTRLLQEASVPVSHLQMRGLLKAR